MQNGVVTQWSSGQDQLAEETQQYRVSQFNKLSYKNSV
jgi:hypothetical protein